MAFDLAALQRRLMGQKDPRSSAGILARGSNVYKGTSTRAHAGGGSNFGAPKKTPSFPNVGQTPTSKAPRFPTIGKPSIPTAQKPISGGEDRMWFGGTPPWIYDESVGGPNPSTRPQQQQPSTSAGQQPPFSFSFSPLYEAAMRRIQGGLAGLSSSEELAKRRVEEQTAEQARGLDKQRDQFLESNMENMADRGLVRSGINLGQQAKIGEQYQGAMGQLGTEKARSLEEIAQQIAAQRQQFEDQTQSLEFDRAREEMDIRRREAESQAQTTAAQQQAREIRRQIDSMMPKPTPTGQYTAPQGTVADVQRLEQEYQSAVAAAQAHLEKTGSNDPKLVSAAKSARKQKIAAKKR